MIVSATKKPCKNDYFKENNTYIFMECIGVFKNYNGLYKHYSVFEKSSESLDERKSNNHKDSTKSDDAQSNARSESRYNNKFKFYPQEWKRNHPKTSHSLLEQAGNYKKWTNSSKNRF
jgi:hypothetical protein